MPVYGEFHITDVNRITIMMASFLLSSPSVSAGVSSALEVYHN